jgi:hypothetical protein
MTQDEIIEMAKQAHFDSKTSVDIYKDDITTGDVLGYLQAFAKLVEEKATEEANARANASWTLMCEKMVAFEREACAKVCDELQDIPATEPHHCAEDIRARG